MVNLKNIVFTTQISDSQILKYVKLLGEVNFSKLCKIITKLAKYKFPDCYIITLNNLQCRKSSFIHRFIECQETVNIIFVSF